MWWGGMGFVLSGIAIMTKGAKEFAAVVDEGQTDERRKHGHVD